MSRCSFCDNLCCFQLIAELRCAVFLITIALCLRRQFAAHVFQLRIMSFDEAAGLPAARVRAIVAGDFASPEALAHSQAQMDQHPRRTLLWMWMTRPEFLGLAADEQRQSSPVDDWTASSTWDRALRDVLPGDATASGSIFVEISIRVRNPPAQMRMS